MVMFKVTICDIGKMNINMTDKIEKRRQPLQYRTMAMTTTIMSMVRASAAMTAAWKLRRHELCRELQRITSKRATHTRRCSSTTTQTIWVAVVTSPTLTARWCSILSMCLSVKSLLRNATTFGITPYLFNAKEFDEETGMYYYGARYYEPRLSLWMSVDPLQEKYPNISTYCYAANNPIKFIDSDGRKLLFASGTTEAFKQKFRAAIMYLHEHNADGIIAQIDKSSTIIYITERVGEASAFSKTKKTIYWDPNMGVLTSPAEREVPRTIRSTTILFVRCCCDTGWAKYTVCPLRLPIGCVFDFTSNSIILLIVYGYQLFNVVFSYFLPSPFNTHIRVMMNTLIRVLVVTPVWVTGHNVF
jgi:RHS repeat-associated protein